MLLRQLFDPVSCTYTYLLAGGRSGEALIIDPVLERVDRYMQLLDELDLSLVKAIDTHVHADHLSGLAALRDRTKCVTVMGEQCQVDVVSIRVADGDPIYIDGLELIAMHTPGHTPGSYSFRMNDRVFTGDTLLIRGSGRTDFQGGDARDQYDSIFNKLLALPDETLVYPGHDYKGDAVSTIREEREHNPRLQVSDAREYVALMNGLNLPNPKMMDVALPANLRLGLPQDIVREKGWAVTAQEALPLVAQGRVIPIDLRGTGERTRHGVLEGSVHSPYSELASALAPGGHLHALADSESPIMFYCAHGERSAMAVETSRTDGLATAVHLHGGLAAWLAAGGPL